MNNISIFGTHSDAGKSVITLALCSILKQNKFNPAPFKAQNMSNNSAVADDGAEIGRAQYFQAESISIPTSYHINPILLKPEGNGFSQVIKNGVVDRSYHALDYYKNIDSFKKVVVEAFEYLSKSYYPIVAEGAGSPVELNLTDRDLANTFIATHFRTKIILVANIEQGGVFASIYGTYNLLPKNLQENVIGIIINKFRGDRSLFDKGIEIIKSLVNVPVLGIIPYTPMPFDMEDSLSLDYFKSKLIKEKNINSLINIGVIKFPHISNANDIDPFLCDCELNIDFIEGYKNLSSYDLVILPGTKNTIKDLRWLKQTGLFRELKETRASIFGICGGYQMMFTRLNDPYGVENNNKSTSEDGLKFIEGYVNFNRKKTLNRGQYKIQGKQLSGYEIHNARLTKHELFYEKNKICGTHIHGIFANDSFKNQLLKDINKAYTGYKSFNKIKEGIVDNFVNEIASNLDIKLIKSIL